MSKTVKVTYNSETLMTEITVDGQSFDTSRINGKEIADWAYPFMMRKIKWNGFYDEMVEALGGEKSFDLIFDGSEDDLNELKEAWEDAPVNIISEECSGNNVVIEYDEDTLSTNITVNGVPFDTSRINGKEIDDWVYPFMMRKVKWDGIFEELANVTGSEEYTIEFSGSNSAMKVLMEECPEDVEIIKNKNKSADNKAAVNSNNDELTKAEELYISGKTKEAFPIFEKLAENGNARAMYFLGEYYIQGNRGVEKDDEKGKFWRDKGAEAGDPLAKLNQGYNYEEERADIMGSVFSEIQQMAESGDIIAQNELSELYLGEYPEEEDAEQGIYWLKKSAQNGYWWSQYKLGDCYYMGTGVEDDDSEAVKWYRKSAEQGCIEAKSMLADCYSNGVGINQDYQKAFELYSQIYNEQGTAKLISEVNSAENYIYSSESPEFRKEYAFNLLMSHSQFDEPKIYFLIGKCFDEGIGTQQNYSEAVKWYTKAAEQGNMYAQYSLGVIYYLGDGVIQNREKAVEWFKKSAEQGNVYAQNSLGDCYALGEGVEQNYEKAVEWYTKAAEQGNVDAQNALGICYQYGQGVTENSAKAVELYEKAVKQNDGYGCYLLGQCYRTGVGVNTDKNLALELFKKGAELGDKNSNKAYNDMLKNGDTLNFAKKVGLNFIKNSSGFLGNIGSAVYEAMQDNKNQSNDYE